ncbi:MAG: alanine--tRNA ligase [Candidatus Paceibacterota bacterium]
MTGNEVRKKYLEFMMKNEHAVIPSAPLIPENDPTTLFTGSGMQPLIPYLLGKQHPKGTRLTNAQKCFRAEDIDDVGDNRHTTFFEMLGNWSLGDYFKHEQLPWIYTFLTSEIGLDPSRLFVTVFMGDAERGVPKDIESAAIWKELFVASGVSNEIAEIGSEADGYARGMKEGERIFYYDEKNWWSRSGKPENMPVGEVGGPDSEIFYDFGTLHNPEYGLHCHPNCDCGRFLEIGNSVFIEYKKMENGAFKQLTQRNVDFGGGLERITAAKGGDADVFNIDLLHDIIDDIEKLSGTAYEDNISAFRIIADHVRGAVFMIGDRVFPSNTEQGYFVRRLLRRSVRYADTLGIKEGELSHLAQTVIANYGTHYPTLTENESLITDTIQKEEEQFRKTLEKGLKEFEKRAKNNISGSDAFILFSTYGFPFELTLELAAEKGIEVDVESFRSEMEKHQMKSRAGAEQKFKGGLADHSDKVVRYHTMTHLVLAALRKELGKHVHQAGSNITGERMRFDFTHNDKVTRDVLDSIETFVNDAIERGGTVVSEVLSKSKAEMDQTIEGSFWDTYPDEVNVYTITDNDGAILSKELCGGPHVNSLDEIKGEFKIVKEESSSAGVRRIKAVLTE